MKIEGVSIPIFIITCSNKECGVRYLSEKQDKKCRNCHQVTYSAYSRHVDLEFLDGGVVAD